VILFKVKSIFISVVVFVITYSEINAQQWLGVSGSNYAGTHAIYNNPANIGDSRYKLYINLVANDAFVSNNYVGWGAPYSILQLFTNSAASEYRNSKNVIVFKNSYYDVNTDGEPYHLHLLDDLRGPSFLYTINHKHSVGVLTRIRTAVNFTDASYALANTIRLGTDTLLVKNQTLPLAGTNLNINSYAELGFSYGQVIKDEDEDFVKVGITVKRVVGIYNAHLLIKDSRYTIVDDPAEPNRQIVRIDYLKADYGYTNEQAYENTRASLGWLFGNQSAGSGWGLDLGIVYEYRPDIRKFAYREKGVQKLDPSKNKYEFKIGVSILDIGGINYNNPNYIKNWDVDINNVEFRAADVRAIDGLDDAFNRINNTVGLNDATSRNNFTAGLPTSLQINADYHIKDKFYVNGLLVQSLRGNQSIGMKMPSSLSVTPRWESKWIEVGVPFALLDNYNTFTFGLAARLGPLFIGTDNLGSFLNISKPRGIDLYFGLSVPIFNKPPTLPNACFYEKKEKKNWQFWKRR
jgi:hypothetical protein